MFCERSSACARATEMELFSITMAIAAAAGRPPPPPPPMGYPNNTKWSYHGCLPGSLGANLTWCNFADSHQDRIQSLLVGPTPSSHSTPEMPQLATPRSVLFYEGYGHG